MSILHNLKNGDWRVPFQQLLWWRRATLLSSSRRMPTCHCHPPPSPVSPRPFFVSWENITQLRDVVVMADENSARGTDSSNCPEWIWNFLMRVSDELKPKQLKNRRIFFDSGEFSKRNYLTAFVMYNACFLSICLAQTCTVPVAKCTAGAKNRAILDANLTFTRNFSLSNVSSEHNTIDKLYYLSIFSINVRTVLKQRLMVLFIQEI